MAIIFFVTSNPDKIREVNEILKVMPANIPFVIKGLDALHCTDEIPETSQTIEGNAIQKAKFIYDRYQVDCFAEDTGLEIEALNGQPGVLSARYAGPGRGAEDNIHKVLKELENKTNRAARFKTVIALIYRGKLYTFTGVCSGKISHSRKGSGGFGYDSIFLPSGEQKTFAQMDSFEKNKISHRNNALIKMCEFFNSLLISQK